MYHDFIYNFQLSLYKLLINDNDIKTKVNKIYFSIAQDAKYPFLLINILNVNDISTKVQNIVQLEFEICIFTNDKNRNMALKLASEIENKIKYHSFENVARIKANKIEFQASKDLVSNKFSNELSDIVEKSFMSCRDLITASSKISKNRSMKCI